MTRTIPGALIGLMLLCAGQAAVADEYEACYNDCDTRLSICVAGITAVNDIEIQEVKSQCENENSSCRAKCQNTSQDAQQGEQNKEPTAQQ